MSEAKPGVEIAAEAYVSPLADIEPSVRGTRTVIRAGCRIDSFVKIKPVGGSGDVTIGPYSDLNSGTIIYSGNGVRIGSNVLIAGNVTIVGSDHAFMDGDRLVRDQRFQPSRGGVVIEDDVWIGAGSVILEGSVLRRGCVVGAGSVVRGELPEYSINLGNPVRRVGYRTRTATATANSGACEMETEAPG